MKSCDPSGNAIVAMEGGGLNVRPNSDFHQLFPLHLALQKVMTEPRNSSRALLASALAALRAGRLERAEELCQRLLASAPREPATHQLAATIALQRGRFETAMGWARSCLALRPDHSPTLILGGRAARAAGDLAQAAIWFHRAGELAPDQAEPAFLHGVTRLEQRDADAPPLLERLLREFPDNADGWSEIGTTLRKLGRLEAAAVAFARAARASDEPRRQARLGEVLRALGRSGEAISTFRKALETAPDLVGVRLALGSCLREAGDSRSARVEFERAISIEAGDSRLWFALGLVSEDLLDSPAAIRAYRRSAELDPAFAEAHVNLGLNLQHTGDLKGALESYGRAVRLRSNSFGRVSQALASAKTGQLWLNLGRLRRSLVG